MKRVLTLLAVLIALGFAAALIAGFAGVNATVLVVRGNADKLPLPIELGRVQDAQCGMIIDTLDYAAQSVAPDGRTWFFHDLGGMPLFLADKPFKNETVLWVHARDSQRWINAREAFYSRTEDTPMFYGFGAYEAHEAGRIDYATMEAMMLRGENLTNPAVKRKLMGAE